MSLAPHSCPLASSPEDNRLAYLTYQIAGGAIVLDPAFYDAAESEWALGSTVTVFSAARVAELIGSTVLFYQPTWLEPSCGVASDGAVWVVAASQSGALLMARYDGSVADLSEAPGKPVGPLWWPGLFRCGSNLYLRAQTRIDGTAGSAWTAGDMALMMWRLDGETWVPLGVTQDDALALAWYNAAGAGGYQYYAADVCPGPANDELLVAYPVHAAADPAGQPSAIHFIRGIDYGNTWEDAAGNELGTLTSGLPVVAGDTGTVVASEPTRRFFKHISVSCQPNGAPVVAATRVSDSVKVLYIWNGSSWTTRELGSVVGITPNRAFCSPISSGYLAVPDDTGWFVSTDSGATFPTFTSATAEQMGAGNNMFVDKDFLARTGWVRSIGRKLSVDGGTTDEIVVSETNLFGADAYPISRNARASTTWTGRNRWGRVA